MTQLSLSVVESKFINDHSFPDEEKVKSGGEMKIAVNGLRMPLVQLPLKAFQVSFWSLNFWVTLIFFYKSTPGRENWVLQ